MLQGSVLVLVGAILFYDSLVAVPFLCPLLWLWHRERREPESGNPQHRGADRADHGYPQGD